MRDWQDERWVKLYTRDEPEWLVLPWKARGLFDEILKRVDPAGVMRLGKAGRKAIAAALSATWDSELAETVGVLEEDGAIQFLEGETLLRIPNFVEAQESKQSDKVRQQKRRARARAFENVPVTKRDSTVTAPNTTGRGDGEDATRCDESRQSIVITPRDGAVTKRDTTITHGDQTVTRGHAVSRREEKRREEREEIPPVVPPGGTLTLTSGPEPPKARTIKVVLPADWAPTTAHYQQAMTEGGKNALWVESEARRMRDWAASKGERCVDWDARFRNWMRRALDTSTGLPRRPPPQPGHRVWKGIDPDTIGGT